MAKDNPSETYADYELARIDKSRPVKVKFRDADGDITLWMRVSPASMAKIAAILRQAPEGQW